MADVIILGVLILLLYLMYRIWRLKKDIYQFADSLEQNSDKLISGKELLNFGDTSDNLLGKINEKLQRAAHIWKKKESEINDEKK